MSERVSIIVPVYNAASYIAETIAMVVKQTYSDWELLLVEDCSPDKSADFVRSTLGMNGFERRSVSRQICRR